VEDVMLRQGNVHTAEDWRSVLEPVVARYRGGKFPFYFRADAGFANPEVTVFIWCISTFYGFFFLSHFIDRRD
jgi:hypothetical protein